MCLPLSVVNSPHMYLQSHPFYQRLAPVILPHHFFIIISSFKFSLYKTILITIEKLSGVIMLFFNLLVFSLLLLSVDISNKILGSYIHIHIYIHIHMYTHTYICVYIYTYIYVKAANKMCLTP